jgi:phage-related baseplate assembly protein
MNDQIVMSPNNAEVCIAIPLFRRIEYDCLAKMNDVVNFKVSVEQERPLAYILDMDTACEVVSAEWLESKLIFLGDL